MTDVGETMTVLTWSLVSGVTYFLLALGASKIFTRNNSGGDLRFREVVYVIASAVGVIIINGFSFTGIALGFLIGAIVVMPAIAYYYGVVRSWWKARSWW